jgi:hypothetical protein
MQTTSGVADRRWACLRRVVVIDREGLLVMINVIRKREG